MSSFHYISKGSDGSPTGPQRLDGLGPSVKFVYYVLRQNGPMTRGEIEAETGMPRRTVLLALRQLREQGVVESRPIPTEANAQRYALTDGNGMGDDPRASD